MKRELAGMYRILVGLNHLSLLVPSGVVRQELHNILTRLTEISLYLARHNTNLINLINLLMLHAHNNTEIDILGYNQNMDTYLRL